MNLRRLAVVFLSLQLGCAATVLAAAPQTGLATVQELDRLPEALLPAATVRAQIDALKNQALTFAVSAPLHLDQRNGSWDAPTPDVARWRLRIRSDGARSLALQLSDLQLPEGAALWFYDASGHDVQGPFTRHSSALVDGSLQLPLVRSSEAVLEVQAPTTARNAVALSLVEAYHGYREFTAATAGSATPKAAVGSDAGSCNIDVTCSAGDSWRNEIRSTVLITVVVRNPSTNMDELFLCSGSLVSNTRQDDRPLILTANHCLIRDSNVSTVIAYFNVQSNSCGSNSDGRVDQNIRGSSFLARDENSDFTLFTLTNPPSATFNVFYAGWDARSGVVPQSGVTVHHPRGDEKKISVYSAAARAVEDQRIGDATDGFNVDAWRIIWARGTTETGSSGSGLWNQNRQLVGVLSGGGASCETPTEPDFFGRLDRAWTANAASNGQLKAHLDPINSNCLQLGSKNPGSASPLAACAPGDDPRTFTDGGGSPGPGLLFGLLLLGLARRRLSA